MNNLILLEATGGGGYGAIVVLILAIMFGPPLLFIMVGFILRNKDKKDQAKIFFILAGVYLVISLGSCGSMLM